MRSTFTFLTIAAISTALAQPDSTKSDLRPSDGRELKKANEVTVVLDPPGAENPVPEKPAENQPLIDNADSLPASENDAPTAAPEPAPKQGLIVRVEKLQTTTGTIDPSSVKLLAPFPAKPLSSIPTGWKLDSSGAAPPFSREIEITPGSKITLNIRPHVLIPDTNGATSFPVSEPGYEAAVGYEQAGTVGAILATSIRQLDDDSKNMGQAIDRLQQLLISLPKPAPIEEPAPAAPPAKPAKR